MLLKMRQNRTRLLTRPPFILFLKLNIINFSGNIYCKFYVFKNFFCNYLNINKMVAPQIPLKCAENKENNRFIKKLYETTF